MPTIMFNGKTYNSIDEMPADVRQTYEHMLVIFKDENGNGIPDFMEGDMVKNVMTAIAGNVNFNGKVYSNLADLPPEAREKVQKAFEKLKQRGILTDMPALQVSTQDSSNFEPAFEASKPLLQTEPTIQETGGRNWMIIVGFLAAVLLCAVAIFVGFALAR